MNICEGRDKTIAIFRYGKKAKVLIGNGVPKKYLLTACKMGRIDVFTPKQFTYK